MTKKEILHCPYCESKNIIIKDFYLKYIQCKVCEACGPKAETVDTAIIRWNVATKALEAKNAEIAEYRRHLAAVMQREANAIAEIERQRLAHTHYYDKYHKAIAERDEAVKNMNDWQWLARFSYNKYWKEIIDKQIGE